MAEVAKMFGKELGEEFTAVIYDAVMSCMFTRNGLKIKMSDGWHTTNGGWLSCLLTGDAVIMCGGLTMAEVDLKRCPFCGGYAHLEDPSEMGDYGVSCENCGAFVMFGAGDGECQTKEEAAEAWNRRVKDDLED